MPKRWQTCSLYDRRRIFSRARGTWRSRGVWVAVRGAGRGEQCKVALVHRLRLVRCGRSVSTRRRLGKLAQVTYERPPCRFGRWTVRIAPRIPGKQRTISRVPAGTIAVTHVHMSCT